VAAESHERRGLLERDTDHSYLSGEAVDAGPIDQLLRHSITYRIAVGPQAGRKVFALQTLPACNELFDDPMGMVVKKENSTPEFKISFARDGTNMLQTCRSLPFGEWQELACAVLRRRFSVGANPTR